MLNKAKAVNRAFNSNARWLMTLKATIARFSRGNIPAQRGCVLTPNEQKNEHAETEEIAQKWHKRAKRSKAA